MDENKPEFNGQCAFAVSLNKENIGKEKYQITKDNKTYYFSGPIAKLFWKILPSRKKKAEENWQKKQNKI